jgi:23S rRNA (uracil-5-)-methyltransferase RumA
MLEGVQARLLLDLYCGTGTIAQMLAEQAEEVIGVEIVPEAVEAAKQNALRNGIFNCTFVADDVLAYLRTCEVSPDVVVLDPPRAGLNPKALKHIIAFEAPNVLYVSCNPNALASDLTAFLEAGYTVQRLAIADMFPHTPHVETVVLLSHTN